MSQQQQRVRRMASPSSSKQGPMKAILHFGLKSQPQELSKSHQNGRKNSPNSSPTPVKSSENHRKTRKSPDFRSSPERSSPSSPGFNKGEKIRPINRQSPGPAHHKRSPLDLAVPYLKGEWPRCSPDSFTHFDKATQTPEEWDECFGDRRKKSMHKRSSSTNGSSADGFVKKGIKACLTNSKVKDISWAAASSGVVVAPSGSSVPLGASISLITTAQQISPTVTVTPVQPNTGLLPPSKAVTIPNTIPRPTSRVRGSVEGFNQEIEKLVLTDHSGNEGEDLQSSTQGCPPDGHQAPVRELLHGPVVRSGSRTVNTQTPSGSYHDPSLHLLNGDCLSSELLGSLTVVDLDGGVSSESPCSFSPVSPRGSPYITEGSTHLPIMPGGHMEGSRPSSHDDDIGGPQEEMLKDNKDCDLINEPNSCQMFVREPPDGCEKVKIMEESRPVDLEAKESLGFCPIRKYASIPSDKSAFCPLIKSYVNQPSEMALKSFIP